MISRPNRMDDAPDLGRLIDRLVDGELSDADRRALLPRLDSEPDGSGWRRCALAFLETRDWREAFADPSIPMNAPTLPNETGVVRRATPPGRPGLPARWLAMAATVALAFVLGRAVGPAAKAPAPSPEVIEPALANVPASTSPSAPSAPSETDPLELDAEQLALDGREPSNPWPVGENYWRPSPSPSSTIRGGGTPWAWSNTPQPIEVPELPAPVVEDWRRRGYEVETRPRIVTVGAEGERPVPVPVNEVRVRYVGDRTY